MTTLSGGNLSIKDDSGDIWITPTGHDRLSSASEDVVLVRHGVREAGKLASRAVRLHEAIYARHPGINCVMTVGTDILNAFDRLEVAEYSARSLIDTVVLGTLVPIGDVEIHDLETAFGLV